MTKNEVLSTLSDKKAFIEKEFEVSKIGLFGSYAKNLQTDDSDIDIYVEFKNKTFDNIAGLWNYLEDVYHKKIDLIHFHKRANGSIMKSIQKEVIYG